jgi:hypothetical protein
MTNPHALLNHIASQECFKIAKGVGHTLCLLYAYNNDEDDNVGDSRALFMLDSAIRHRKLCLGIKGAPTV